jgi:hypothetical protein
LAGFLFVTSFYGNGGTKFPQHLPGAQEFFLISTKTLRTLNGVFFYVGILNKVGISYVLPSAK